MIHARTSLLSKNGKHWAAWLLTGPCLWAAVACGSEAPPGSASPGVNTPTGTAAAPATGTAGTGAAGKAGGAGTTTTPSTGAVAGRGPAGVAGGGTVTPIPSTGGTAGAITTGTAGSTAAGSGVAGAIAGASGAAAGTGTAGTTAGTTGGDVPTTGESSCLDGITDYASDGPFKYDATSEGRVKIWLPMVPAGCKVPIVHLANGTGASCSNYQGALERLASHGFLTLCYEDTNTGAGTQGVEAIDTAMKKYPDLYSKKIGSTGHSQGGQAAFTVLSLAEAKWGLEEYTYAGLAMQPASGFGTQPSGGSWQSFYAKIKSPMFMFSGTADMLVPEAWVRQGLDALDDSIEAYWWSAVGATHIPTPVKEEQAISIPWFRWKLLGDQKACEHFKKMPDSEQWDSRKEQNPKDCM